MIISHAWLSKYFSEKLPSPAELSKLFTFHSCEVEGMESLAGDTIYDLKILPDRAHYALSHRGVAGEVAALTELKMKNLASSGPEATSKLKPSITIADSELCRRYMGRTIENVSIGQSPESLRIPLEAIGQRAISTIVDATNYVMFDVGQPLHAFDADKVKGAITVRRAKAGEVIDLLPERTIGPDGQMSMKDRDIALADTDLVIADEAGPIALAGIKGGKRAAVTETTKNIIIESANFDPAAIRRTSTRYNLRNDSSKRFENEITPELASIAMNEVSDLVLALCPQAKAGPVVDVYPKPIQKRVIMFDPALVESVLGTKINESDMFAILDRIGIKVSKDNSLYKLEIPFERLDLVIPEDIVEEIGRIYGYDKIPAELLLSSGVPNVEKTVAYEDIVRDTLVSLGFSEVSTYVFKPAGDIEIAKPLAADKKFLRNNLSQGIADALAFNARNADFLGLDRIRIFEIGKIFSASGEKSRLALGVKNVKKLKQKESDALAEAVKKLAENLGVDQSKIAPGPITCEVIETDFEGLVSQLPEPKGYVNYALAKAFAFKPISAYPFAVRDIAVFTPDGTKEAEVKELIERESGLLLAREPKIFDVFTKTFPDGSKKTSYAFRMVFQSHERTLSEEEINSVMKKITDAMTQDVWQVR